MATVAAVSARSQSTDAAALAKVSDAMSRQWNADMMHDALRADVMSALYARTDAQRADLGVNEVTDHAAAMLENVDLATEAAPDDLAKEFRDLRPAMARYTELAKRIATTATTEHDAAVAGLPGFMSAFADLEDRLGVLDQQLSAAVVAQQQETDAAGSSSLRWIISCGALVAAALVAFSVWMFRAIRRPLQADQYSDR
jgi:methyl-accepting chemotaxis protein